MQRLNLCWCQPKKLFMRKLIFFFISLFVLIISSSAQDKIYRKNGEVLKVKVLEVSSSEIKYKIFGDNDGPVYVLEKDRIKKIEYENGRVEKPTVNLKDPEQYADQLNKALKINFLSPLLGFTQISYEKSTGVGKSYELSFAVIGAGKNRLLDFYDYNSIRSERKNQFGLAIGAGYKFSKLPDFLFGRTRFTHLMQGAYAKPVVYLGNYSENRVAYKNNNQYVVERQNVTFGALEVELGKQWVFGDKFLIDIYTGLGWGADNKKSDGDIFFDNDTEAYNYLNQRLGKSPGLSLNAGLKLGLLIK
jgi:hypothetical protein